MLRQPQTVSHIGRKQFLWSHSALIVKDYERQSIAPVKYIKWHHLDKNATEMLLFFAYLMALTAAETRPGGFVSS